MPRIHRPAVLALAVLLAVPGALSAQESRAEEIARKQAEKATRLHPYEPPFGERLLARLEGILEGVQVQGPYPWLGSIYPGGSLGLGGGYRYGFAGSASFNVLGGWSLRNYNVVRADLGAPALAGGRLLVAGHFSRIDAPRVAFYGVGNDTSRDGRTRFAYQPTRIGADATLRVAPALKIGGGIDHLATTADSATGEPRADVLLSVVDPAGELDVDYTVGRAFAAVDWRDSPGYSRRGGLYRIEGAQYTARRDAPFDFRRTEAEIVQLVPILRANWVLAFRGLVTMTDVDGGQAIPFFLLPDLGGGSTLRGYPSWRFRDRHRLLLSGEYRWTPGQLLDMALFVDAGKVASRTGDLDLNDLHTNYGIGVRIHGLSFTALRLDVARGREGFVLNLGVGAAF